MADFRKGRNNTETAFSAFGKFKAKLADFLTFATIIRLAIVFEYPPSMIDELQHGESQSLLMIRFMEERGQIQPTDITELLNALKKLELRGTESSVRKHFEDYTGLTCCKNEVPKLHIEGKLDTFLNYLKTIYAIWYNKVQPIPYIRGKTYCVNDVYVEGGIEVVETSVRKAQSFYKTLKRISFRDVFDKNKILTNRIFLEGDPGYGKSTFTLQAAYDWCSCNISSPLNCFELFVLLPMRFLRSGSSIFECIRLILMPSESRLTDLDIQDILMNCSSMALVLDGYDEYPDRTSDLETDVGRIIKGTMFANCKVVVSTRSSSLPSDADPSTVTIRLTGFDKESIYEYIKRAVTGDNEEEARKIESVLNSSPVLFDICQVPLFCVMFAHISKDDLEIAKRLTSVTSFLRNVISCFYSQMRRKGFQAAVSDIPEYHSLNKLAFDSLTDGNQQLIWQKHSFIEKVGLNCYEELSSIGILAEEQLFKINDSPGADVSDCIKYDQFVCFYHKLFAEWYAGRYLSSYTGTFLWPTLENRLRQINPVDLQFVFRFACGLNEEASQMIIRYLNGLKGGKAFASLCFFEQSDKAEDPMNLLRGLCTGCMVIRPTDSRLLKRSYIQFLDIASRHKIPVPCVFLQDTFSSAWSNELYLESEMTVPILSSLEMLVIETWSGSTLNQEQVLGIISYVQQCKKLKKVSFINYVLPLYFCGESLSSIMTSHHTNVYWIISQRKFQLDMSSGKWKLDHLGSVTLESCGIQDLADVCDKTIYLREEDSDVLQRGIFLLLQLASDKNIPVGDLRLVYSFRGMHDDKILLESGLCLSILGSVKKISIVGDVETELTKEDVAGLINVGLSSQKFHKLRFFHCKLPNPVDLRMIAMEARRRSVKVISSVDARNLDLTSGYWKRPADIDAIAEMCSDTLCIDNYSSTSVQRSVIDLMVNASNHDIPISELTLGSSFSSTREDGNIILCSNLSLPILASLEKMQIQTEYNRVLMEEEVSGILHYVQQCRRLRTLTLENCLLPSRIHIEPSLSSLVSRQVNVFWQPENIKDQKCFQLNVSSGNWLVKDTLNLLHICDAPTVLRKFDKKQNQNSLILLLQMSSKFNIPIYGLLLKKCFRGCDGSYISLESGLLIPTLSSLQRISIVGDAKQILGQNELIGLLNFAVQSTQFKELWLYNLRLSSSSSGSDIPEKAMNIKVTLVPDLNKKHESCMLDCSSGNWLNLGQS